MHCTVQTVESGDDVGVHTGQSGSSVRENLTALRSAQKPARGTAAYSRHINRPLGRFVAAIAHTAGLSPNQATAISATLSGTAIVLLATAEPGWRLGLTVSSLLAAGYVMDSVDGQLARLRGTSSRSGEWLDHTVDCFKTIALHLAVLISWYQYPPVDSEAILLVPLAFEVVDVVTFFGFMFLPMVRPTSSSSGSPPPEHPLRTWMLLPSDYGAMVWLFALLAWPQVFCAAYTAMFAINALLLVLALRKWWRELRTIDGLR